MACETILYIDDIKAFECVPITSNASTVTVMNIMYFARPSPAFPPSDGNGR